MKLTNPEALEALGHVKRLHELAEKTEDKGLVRAMAALHENAKRYGEKHHGAVVVQGGDT